MLVVVVESWSLKLCLFLGVWPERLLKEETKILHWDEDHPQAGEEPPECPGVPGA